MKFAKLFGPDDDQILIKMDDGDNGPEVRVYFKPPNLGVCNLALSFGHQSDEDAAWDACQQAFDKLDEQEARKIVAAAMRDLPFTSLPAEG